MKGKSELLGKEEDVLFIDLGIAENAGRPVILLLISVTSFTLDQVVARVEDHIGQCLHTDGAMHGHLLLHFVERRHPLNLFNFDLLSFFSFSKHLVTLLKPKVGDGAGSKETEAGKRQTSSRSFRHISQAPSQIV